MAIVIPRPCTGFSVTHSSDSLLNTPTASESSMNSVTSEVAMYNSSDEDSLRSSNNSQTDLLQRDYADKAVSTTMPIYCRQQKYVSPKRRYTNNRRTSRNKSKSAKDIGTMYLNRRLERDVDVRYITNFLKCLNKFQPNYDCTQEGCPNLVARMHDHRSEYHKNRTVVSPIPQSYEVVTAKRNKIQPVPVTVSASGIVIEAPMSKDNNFTQTKITLADLGSLTIKIEPNNKNGGSRYRLVNATNNDLNPTTPDSDENLDFRYYSALVKEIYKWAHKLPLHPNENDDDIKKRECIINKLINDIMAIMPRADSKQYETRISNTTESALRNMNLKYPIDHRKEFAIKKDLHDDILARIHNTNKKILGIVPTTNIQSVISNRSGKESQTRKRENSSVERKLSLNRRRRDSGSRITNFIEDPVDGKNMRSSPISGILANGKKTDSSVTLGRDRKRTESLNSIADASTFDRTASFNRDDDNDFGILHPKDLVSSGYVGNGEDSSATSSVPEAKQEPHMERAYTNTGQDEEFELDSSTSFTGNEVGHICIKVKSLNGTGTKKRSMDFKTGWNQKTADQFSQETCQKSSNSYLGKHSVRCTLSSQKSCICAEDLQRQGKYKNNCRDLKREMEFEILNWISSTNMIKFGAHTRREDIVNAVVDCLSEYLDKPNYEIDNTFIKTKLYAIFKSFGIEPNTDNLRVAVDKIIDNLVKKLINIRQRTECSKINTLKRPVKESISHVDYATVKHIKVYKDKLQHNLMLKVMKCLKKDNANRDVLNKITEVLIRKIGSTETTDYKDVIYDIAMILKVNGKSEKDSKQLAEIIVENVKHVLEMASKNGNNTLDMSNSFVTYSPDDDFCGPSFYTSLDKREPSCSVSTSTSETKRSKRDIQSSSANEKAYMDKIAVVVEYLFNKYRNFNHEENKGLQATSCNNITMLYELAGEILAYKKLNQLAGNTDVNQDRFMHYQIYEWLTKFEIFDDVRQNETVDSEISQWSQTIDVSDMKNPSTVTTQPITNAKEIGGGNTQYPKRAKSKKIQERIEMKISQEIEGSIQKNIEQNKDIEVRLVTHKKMPKNKSVEVRETAQNVHTDLKTDVETTMKEYILKYIHQNYEVDDAILRGVYAQILKSELQKLDAATGKEKETFETFSPQNLDKELQYVKDISDWLKNLPIEGSFNVLNNKNRIDFINYLAKNIVTLENERAKKPDAIDYNTYLGTIITQFTEQLPLLPGPDNITYMVDQLLKKVVARRNQALTYSPANEPKFTEFIDQYVRVRGREIADDELKLEAWSARLLKEMQKIINEPDATVLNKSKTYKKLSFVSTSDSQSVKRFQQELEIAKEIVDWLKNLLLLESNADVVILLASDLAQKISAAEVNKSDSQVKEEFDDYLDYWFKQLPIQERQDIDKAIAVEQIMNRIKKVTENKYKKQETQRKSLSLPSQGTRFPENEGNVLKIKSKKFSNDKSYPGQKLVKAVDNWCGKLSFDNGNPETIKIAKDNIATKLYQKIHALNNEPRINADDSLFTREMGFEIDNVLQNLPEKLKLKGDQNALRQRLLLKIKTAREEIVDILAGDNYKAALVATLNNSLPNPIPAEYDPWYDVYKNKLADLFILENFDYSINNPNRKYENDIKSKINQLSQSAQKRNAVSLSKEDIYNELYSCLYKVPIPNENIMADKVEEIKTRCEIDSWFDNLPIKPPQDLKELKHWDLILSTLAKRIYYIEKEKTNTDEKIHKEITKLLTQFPLLEGSVDYFANILVTRLKSSEKYRKCIKSGDYVDEPVKMQMYPTVPLSNDQLKQVHDDDCKKRGVDIIADEVETWCSKLPIIASNIEEENSIRDGIVTDILKKLSELNSDPEVFDGDIVYDYLLIQELDRILNKLPQNNSLENKELRKEELVQAVKQARNVLKEERIKHDYIDDLRLVVISVLSMPQNDNIENDALYDHTVDKVVNNFVEYTYNRDDDEAKQFYKLKIFKDIKKYITKVKDQADPLVVTNIIVCDMAKLPIPKDYVIREQINEIRMRNDVKSLVNDIFPRNEKKQKYIIKNQHINCLTKILCSIEKSGHNEAIDSEMEKAILKTLNKLKPDIAIDDKKINDFIGNLKESEPFRKAFPFRKAKDLASLSQSEGVQPSKISMPDQPHLETKRRNTIDYSNFNTDYPAVSSPIKPNIGDGWYNKYAFNENNLTCSSLLASGARNTNPNKIEQMNQTVQYPCFSAGFPAASMSQPKANVRSNLPLAADNLGRLSPCHPKEGTVESWCSSESGAEIRVQEVSAMMHDPLLISNPAEYFVQPWTSTASGAQLQKENISAQIHKIPGPDTPLQPFKAPPELDFKNTSTQPAPYVLSPSNTRLSTQGTNISAEIHNIPGSNIYFQPFKPPPVLDFTNTSTQPRSYALSPGCTCPSTQGTNISFEIHNIPGSDIYFQPYKPPPVLDFTNTSAEPRSYVQSPEFTCSSTHGTNISAEIHNIPGSNIYFQPFKPPPVLDFTNTSTQPRSYALSPGCTWPCPSTRGIEKQPFSIVPPKVDSKFTTDRVSPTVSSPCQRNQENEHLSGIQIQRPDNKEAALPRRQCRRVSIREPFEDVVVQKPSNYPEHILNAQNMKLLTVPSPIPNSLVVPRPVCTFNTIEKSPGTGLKPTSSCGSGRAAHTSNDLKESTGARLWARELDAEKAWAEFNLVKEKGTDTSTECIPCAKYFKKRSAHNCVCPLSLMDATSCCPC